MRAHNLAPASAHVHLLVGDEGADGALGLEVTHHRTAERGSHLEALRDDRGRDHLHRRHLLAELVVRGLIEKHRVVQLFLGARLRPLLLCLAALLACHCLAISKKTNKQKNQEEKKEEKRKREKRKEKEFCCYERKKVFLKKKGDENV